MSDNKPKRTGAAAPGYWTPERRQAARDLWTAERRLELALKRKANPQGNRDPAWWAQRRRKGEPTLEEVFAMVDRVRKRLQEGRY